MDTNPFKHTASDDSPDGKHPDGHVEAVGPDGAARTGSHVESRPAEAAQPTLSETLATLVGLIPITAWATLRWRHARGTGPKDYAVELPSGRRVTVGARGYDALARLVTWTTGRSGAPPRIEDWMVPIGIRGQSGFLGERWVRAIVRTGDVTYERYVAVRERFDAEIAAGVSDRSAWGRAREGLRGVPVRDPTQSGRVADVRWLPVELRPAVEQLADRLGLSPATARNYRSVLRRIFDRAGGRVPDEANIGRVLDHVARRWPYCAEAPSVWRTLARSATWDGVTLPVPART